MKIHAYLILLMLAAALGGAASAQTTSDTAFSQVVVSKFVIDPAVMMPGDTGTITVTMQNTGTEAVDIARATLYNDGITVLNPDAYDAHVTLGPANTKDFTFFVTATGQGGLYQPKFYVDFVGTGFFSYLIPLRIDGTPLQVSVASVPDYFATGREDQVVLQVGNPRDNNLTSITITPNGDGIRTIQSSKFIGNLGSGQTTQVAFDVIPSRSTTLTFNTSYRNGVNAHSVETEVPVLIDNNRRSADLVINNVKLTSTGGSSQLDGDITNGGLDDAKSVVLSTQSPATPVDPYPSYVIGSLAVDDFSSFTLTFTGQGLISVPVLVQWKDSDGNSYQDTIPVNLRTATAGGTTGSGALTGPRGGGGPFGFFGGGRAGLQIPFIPILIILVIVIALIVAWRKGAFARFRKKGKGKQGNGQVRK